MVGHGFVTSAGPSRGEIVLSLFAFLFLVAALFHDVTLGGKTVAAAPHVEFTLPTGPVGIHTKTLPFADPYGPAWIHEANVPFRKRALGAGTLPFWNPHEACGNPYWALLQPGLLFPPNMFMYVLPPTLGFDIAYLSKLVLAGWLMYLFLRVHRLLFWSTDFRTLRMAARIAP